MSYWIICLPREDMLHCIDIGVFGLRRPQAISHVKEGDKVVCVVTREKTWKVIAIGEATSDYYVDDEDVFKQPGMFIDRFKFKIQRLKPELSFPDFINKLSCITKPQYWTVYFKNGIAKLSKEDWVLFCEASSLPVE
ncbi:MAG: hypothetical protein C0507_15490 [Cyanobacteria bacterium PR.3.49]|nr:hypothetical protein [Cyanobacteria bacterium PR.3.49]